MCGSLTGSTDKALAAVLAGIAATRIELSDRDLAHLEDAAQQSLAAPDSASD